jgi:hypothetical protein
VTRKLELVRVTPKTTGRQKRCRRHPKTFAEYMDSTPELRMRRDGMLAALDQMQEERHHPLRRFADAGGFLRLTGRVHYITGEMIDLDPPHEVHQDDVDWYERLWKIVDDNEYQVRMAVLASVTWVDAVTGQILAGPGTGAP